MIRYDLRAEESQSRICIMINRYLNATGPFLPHMGETAAMKLAIASILDRRLLQWVRFLVDEGNVHNEFEGDPGWNILRRDSGRWHHDEFHSWPMYAVYRAHVEPEALNMKFPDCFMDRARFVAELSAQLELYAIAFPGDTVRRNSSRRSAPRGRFSVSGVDPLRPQRCRASFPSLAEMVHEMELGAREAAGLGLRAAAELEDALWLPNDGSASPSSRA